MGGSSTYGIEQPNGYVLYNIYRDSVFIESIVYEFSKGRTLQLYDLESIETAQSIKDYYSEKRYEEEDSVVRGVLRLDGVLEWRLWGEKGVFKYYQNQ
jgi:hypothetical protein